MYPEPWHWKKRARRYLEVQISKEMSYIRKHGLTQKKKFGIRGRLKPLGNQTDSNKTGLKS